MNTATALRELRRLIKHGATSDIAYRKYGDFLNFPSLDQIVGKELKLSIIVRYVEKNEKSLLSYANGLNDNQFSFARYEQYVQFRINRKSDSWSTDFFKLKFGDDWEKYYSNRKQTRHNMYDLSHVMNKHKCSVNDANLIIKQLKEKTTNSLQRSIKKYGKLAGPCQFYKACRVHKNYIDYWNSIYPDNLELAKKKFKEYTTSASLKHVNYYLKKGYTQQEAIQLISAHQLTTAGVHRKYYEYLGMSSADIDNIMNDINRRKDSSSLLFLSSKHEDLSAADLQIKYNSYNLVKSSSYRQSGYLRKDDPNLPDKEAYYIAVDFYTRKSVKSMSPPPNKRGRQTGQFHVDHKYSKHQGFIENVQPSIIGHIINLEWLPAEINSAKRANCSITKDKLLSEYTKHENQIN
jgi:hypothetical protein